MPWSVIVCLVNCVENWCWKKCLVNCVKNLMLGKVPGELREKLMLEKVPGGSAWKTNVGKSAWWIALTTWCWEKCLGNCMYFEIIFFIVFYLVRMSSRHSDQMYNCKGSQVSNFTIATKISQSWQYNTSLDYVPFVMIMNVFFVILAGWMINYGSSQLVTSGWMT